MVWKAASFWTRFLEGGIWHFSKAILFQNQHKFLLKFEYLNSFVSRFLPSKAYSKTGVKTIDFGFFLYEVNKKVIKSGTFSNTFVHHGLHAQLSLLQLLILVWGDRVSFYRLSAVKLQVVSKRQIRDSSQTFSTFLLKKNVKLSSLRVLNKTFQNIIIKNV